MINSLQRCVYISDLFVGENAENCNSSKLILASLGIAKSIRNIDIYQGAKASTDTVKSTLETDVSAHIKSPV